MPERKKPASLQNIALDLLLEHIVNYCDKLSATGSLEKLRQGISVIKDDVYPRIVWHLLPKFCEKFLHEFCSKERPEWQYQAALEIIMDVDIIGLRCVGSMMEYFDPRDGQRFRRLVELDLSHFSTGVYYARTIRLEDFHLDHLTTFIFPYNCSDLHLTVIGQNCSKLHTLKIRHSSDVTDDGLRALSSCRELRVVDIVSCQGITHIGVNHLLSVHTKLEDFSCCQAEFDSVFINETDFLSCFDTLRLCPSMNRFSIDSAYITDAHVRSIGAKFPNLNHLRIFNVVVENLSTLRIFSKLHSIELVLDFAESSSDIERALRCLRELLTFFGTNIRTLTFCNMTRVLFLKQNDLNFIFESCPSIENLAFDHGYEDLVIPSFQKLKDLSISARPNSAFDAVRRVQELRFSKMSNLKDLALNHFGVGLDCVKSMILDNIRFPKLTVLKTNSLTVEGIQEIEQIARDNNLNFSIVNRGYPSHVTTRIELV